MIAVADHDPFREPQATAALLADPVDIDAARKQIRASIAHDAHNEKRRLGRDAVYAGCSKHRQTDDMAVALALVNVGSAQRRNPVTQHGTRVSIDDTGAVAAPVVLG